MLLDIYFTSSMKSYTQCIFVSSYTNVHLIWEQWESLVWKGERIPWRRTTCLSVF